MINNTTNKIIPIKKLATGDQLSINVIEIEGKKPGPTCYIQASVHGAEIQGNLVIYELLETLKKTPINGKFIIVPNANPYATIQKSGPYTQGRFNPVTGNNYNRNYTDIFQNSEGSAVLEKFLATNTEDHGLKEKYKKLIQSEVDRLIESKRRYGLSDDFYLNIQLQKLAANADICLDLHTGPVACEYLYSNHSQKQEVINDFPFEFVLSIPEEFAGAMDEAFFINYTRLNKLLKESNRAQISCSSYTVELGSEELIDSKIAANFTNKILYFLHKKEMISTLENEIRPQNNETKYIDLSNYKTYYAPTGGHVEYIASPGEKIKKGKRLAVIYSPNKKESAFDQISVNAIEDCWVINYQNSSTVHEGMELYQVGENAETISFK